MRNAIATGVFLVLMAIGVGLLLGTARRHEHAAAPPAAPAAPSTPVVVGAAAGGAPRSAAPTPPASAGAAGGTSALELAEEFRLDMCDCASRDCVDQANHRYVRALGSVVAGSFSEAARKEMHAATECIVRLNQSWSDSGP